MISDASPLIIYAKAGRLELLRSVAGTLVVAPEVRHECVEKAPDLPDAALLRDAFEDGWLEVAEPAARDLAHVRRRHPHLGPGESASIALGRSMGEDVLLLDDRAVRRAARLEGLQPVGCLGFLAAAIRRDVIDREAAHQAFSDLLSAGLWVSGAVAERFWHALQGPAVS